MPISVPLSIGGQIIPPLKNAASRIPVVFQNRKSQIGVTPNPGGIFFRLCVLESLSSAVPDLGVSDGTTMERGPWTPPDFIRSMERRTGQSTPGGGLQMFRLFQLSPTVGCHATCPAATRPGTLDSCKTWEKREMERHFRSVKWDTGRGAADWESGSGGSLPSPTRPGPISR